MTFGTAKGEHLSSVKNFSQIELVKLIKACRASGVSELSLGDLSISFGDQTKVDLKAPTVTQTKGTEIKAEEISAEDLETQSRQTKEEQLAFMQIENPSAFEQLMIEGELEDAGQPPSEEH